MSRLFLACTLLACFPSRAFGSLVADLAPSAGLTVSGFPTLALDSVLDVQSGVYSYGSATALTAATGASFSVSSLWFDAQSDPFVDYGFSIENTGATPLTVSFTVSSPYVGGPYNMLTDSFSDSVTDSGNTPDGQVTIGVPAGITDVNQPFIDAMNADGINPGCVVTGPKGFSSPGCVSTSTFNNVTVSTATSGTFGIKVNFILSAGDIYTINGRTALTSSLVPEPATVGMLGAGLLGLTILGRKRRVTT